MSQDRAQEQATHLAAPARRAVRGGSQGLSQPLPPPPTRGSHVPRPWPGGLEPGLRRGCHVRGRKRSGAWPGAAPSPPPRAAAPFLSPVLPVPASQPRPPCSLPTPLRTMLSQGRVLRQRPGPPPHWVEGWRTIPVCSSEGWTPDQNWVQTRDSRGLIICQSQHQMGKQSTSLLGDMAIGALPPPYGH